MVVTHGLFTSGFNELNEHFENIFTTNSYADVQIKESVEGKSGYATHKFDGYIQSGSIARTNLLTQVNVF